MKDYMPWKYYADVFSIPYESLFEEGYRLLLFDIDNTLLPYKKDVPSSEIVQLLHKIKSIGFDVCLVSNTWPWKAKKIGKALGVPSYGFSFKPMTFHIMKAVGKNDLFKTLFIGDQIFTDVLGAKRCNIHCILVDPLDTYESIVTMFNRGRENDIINRGDYFE